MQIIYKDEGFAGFYKGTIPKIFQTAPSSAISWTIYELVKRYFLSNNNL